MNFLIIDATIKRCRGGFFHFYKARGKASWYGPGFAGRKTANGERFNPSKLTAAHRTLPFNTKIKVTNLSNGKSVVVRINDRGPYAGRRIIDLSKAAARKIGMLKTGVAKVQLVAVGGPKGKGKRKKVTAKPKPKKAAVAPKKKPPPAKKKVTARKKPARIKKIKPVEPEETAEIPYF